MKNIYIVRFEWLQLEGLHGLISKSAIVVRQAFWGKKDASSILFEAYSFWSALAIWEKKLKSTWKKY